MLRSQVVLVPKEVTVQGYTLKQVKAGKLFYKLIDRTFTDDYGNKQDHIMLYSSLLRI